MTSKTYGQGPIEYSDPFTHSKANAGIEIKILNGLMDQTDNRGKAILRGSLAPPRVHWPIPRRNMFARRARGRQGRP